MQQPKEAEPVQPVQEPEKPMTDQERFASLYHKERGDLEETDELDGATRQMDLPPKGRMRSDLEETLEQPPMGRYDDEEDGYAGPFSDAVAQRIISLAPPITAILCAIILAVGAVAHFV